MNSRSRIAIAIRATVIKLGVYKVLNTLRGKNYVGWGALLTSNELGGYVDPYHLDIYTTRV